MLQTRESKEFRSSQHANLSLSKGSDPLKYVPLWQKPSKTKREHLTKRSHWGWIVLTIAIASALIEALAHIAAK